MRNDKRVDIGGQLTVGSQSAPFCPDFINRQGHHKVPIITIIIFFLELVLSISRGTRTHIGPAHIFACSQPRRGPTTHELKPLKQHNRKDMMCQRKIRRFPGTGNDGEWAELLPYPPLSMSVTRGKKRDGID